MNDRPFGGKLEPGDEVHFVSLLDETGQTLMTVPMDKPVSIPEYASANVSASVSLHVTLVGETTKER